nr:helicase C-terminal domain-containing protein [uncultured Campylobacter sp.]
MANFKKYIKQDITNKTIEPNKIFASLSQKRYQYLRAPQTDVLEKWFEQRDENATVIKMNTGSGKTLAGLLILESCLRENKGPCIYVVPDKYLVEQVKNEADMLGINATIAIQSIEFETSKKILICNAYQLFNGQSKFGIGKPEIEIGSVVIDDAHACIDIINKQFTITINQEDNKNLYNQIFRLFINDIRNQSQSLATKLELNEPNTIGLVPFWNWQDKHQEVFKFIIENGDDDLKKFNLKLIERNFELCRCVVSSSRIEITPHVIPIQEFVSFENAKRKIFMTATLVDDSILSTHFNISEEYLNKPITPKIVNDIGERLIFAPHRIDSDMTMKDIQKMLQKLANDLKCNISIISPSFQKSEIWKHMATNVTNKDNIKECVKELKDKNTKGTIVVFTNRYDGIDLPNEACRILVIDGLPNAQTLIDQLNEGYLQGDDDKILNQKIQKIEQGMGRGIRSNSDYCIVLLLGYDLAKITAKHKDKFSEATKQQFELSEEVMEDCKNIEDIQTTIVQVLRRDENWIQAHNDRILNIEFKVNSLNIFSIELRKAYNFAINKNYKAAQEILENYINKLPQDNKIFIGYAKQILAEYTNFIDQNKAQEILKSACNLNNQILKPINGIEYSKISQQKSQVDNITNYISDFINTNDLIIEVEEILSHLVFTKDTYDKFEDSIKRIGVLLGFYSQRPDKEYKCGPDNFWAIDNKYLIIECKNGAITDTISKSDIEQITSSTSWFNQTYHIKDKNNYFSILIHPSNKISQDAFSNEKIRVMTDKNLQIFKENIRGFFNSIKNKSSDNRAIDKQLKHYRLEPILIIENYTEDYKR